eukprot:136254_1
MSGSRRELSTTPLAHSDVVRLARAGYCNIEDMEGVSLTDLRKDVGFSKEEASLILEMVKAVSGLQLRTTLSYNCSNGSQTGPPRPIVTFCQDLDRILGGGWPRGEVTEVCGIPNTGKTQMCFQLALDVQIPASMGGVQGEAIYIDSEGSLSADRLAEMADAIVAHLKKVARTIPKPGMQTVAAGVTRETLLSGIHSIRVHDHFQQIAAFKLIPSFLRQNPSIKLIVVDSIAFHFRHAFDDNAVRARVLCDMAQLLHECAYSQGVAVLLVNHMTTQVPQRSDSKGGRWGSWLTPALGDSWAHFVTNRIIFSQGDGCRYAELVKSARLKPGVSQFAITTQGIRGVKAPPIHSEG